MVEDFTGCIYFGDPPSENGCKIMNKKLGIAHARERL
jgi:hypothetical protein